MASDHRWYAIREVAELTGVKPVTLRAWQRRYNLISPSRTDSGHRLFSSQDIARIMEIQGWLVKGVPIRNVGGLLLNHTVSVYENAAAKIGHVPLEECVPMLTALADMHYRQADVLVSQVFKEYPLSLVENQFVIPLFEAIDKLPASERALQRGLLQTLLLQRLSLLLEAENKAAMKGDCLCINLDSAGNVFAWLWAAHHAEKGFFTQFIDGADDLAALVPLLTHHQVARLSFFSNRALAPQHLTVLSQLCQQFAGEVVFSPLIDRHHGKEIMA